MRIYSHIVTVSGERHLRAMITLLITVHERLPVVVAFNNPTIRIPMEIISQNNHTTRGVVKVYTRETVLIEVAPFVRELAKVVLKRYRSGRRVEVEEDEALRRNMCMDLE